jgi:two-component system, LytTR family, response regulator
MKAIIFEDEPLVARDLQKLIAQLDTQIDVIETIDSVQKGIAYFQSHPEPDLIFMDIQLSDGVSFEIFDHIKLKCPIIFTTAYNEFALRAFKVNSIDYLLKPINSSELLNALKKMKEMKLINGVKPELPIEELVSYIQLAKAQQVFKDRFTVHAGKSFAIVQSEEIAFFHKSTLIYITTKDKSHYITDYQSLEEIEDLLNPRSFYRANRQYIVHIDAIESYKSDSYGKLSVKLKAPLNEEIIISREKASLFKEWLG